jgi:hypothetical protein
MRISELRKHIKTEFLNNDKISGAEAKELVGLLSPDGLSTHEKRQLGKLRNEFRDKFTDAGLREFDKAVSKASANLPVPTGTVGSGSTLMDIRLGNTVVNAKSTIRLASVEDGEVRRALRRLDFNNDGKVDIRDREKMGFDEAQWGSFLYMAALMGQRIVGGTDLLPADFNGAKVAFTSVPDKDKANGWAEAMNAVIANDVNQDLDYLIVGIDVGTAKDERAFALNALNKANIKVIDYATFAAKAHDAGVTGPAPAGLSAAEFSAKVHETFDDWYKEDINGYYDYELSNATTPDERARIEEDRRVDLDNGIDVQEVARGDYGWFTDNIDDLDYTDRFGVPIPNEHLVEYSGSFFPEYAGIGLGVYLLFDRRTGEHLDTSDIVD